LVGQGFFHIVQPQTGGFEKFGVIIIHEPAKRGGKGRLTIGDVTSGKTRLGSGDPRPIAAKQCFVSYIFYGWSAITAGAIGILNPRSERSTWPIEQNTWI
jgi:hypothetical protein